MIKLLSNNQSILKHVGFSKKSLTTQFTNEKIVIDGKFDENMEDFCCINFFMISLR
jgi:hypothetical protein